jgi:hypothetical protein
MRLNPWTNVPSYLPLFILFFAAVVLGKNIEGSRLPMVFMITALIILQSASVLILTSVFLCVQNYRDPPKDAQKNIYFPAYDFLYSLMLQLTNLQTYVSLIWLYSWWQAFQNSKLKDDLQTCIDQSN